MVDFEFLQNPISKKWVILAPRRSKRTNVKTPVAVCPFCPGQEEEGELFRIQNTQNTQRASESDHQKIRKSDISEAPSIPSFPKRDSDWKVRVIPNKFPFTAHHEIVIHSPDHHKNFDELPFEQVELIFKTYRHRFNELKKHGQVYIFHNRGHAAGESLPHPHTQITVVPKKMTLAIPELDMEIYKNESGSIHSQSSVQANQEARGIFSMIHDSLFMIQKRKDIKANVLQDVLETDQFFVFCPPTSEWPDEVWIAPKQNGNFFGSISDHQVTDLAFTISRLIQIYDARHGYEFPFNFYIYPGENWYLRFIPRLKILGGFELGTQIIVNTQDPKETFAFIRENFWKPDNEKIKVAHQAEYWKSV